MLKVEGPACVEVEGTVLISEAISLTAGHTTPVAITVQHALNFEMPLHFPPVLCVVLSYS